MKYISATTSSILLALSSAAYADTGNYLGVSVGNTDIDTRITTQTAILDEEDSGFKILYGKKLHKNFALEVAYYDYGESSLSGRNGDQFSIDGEVLQFLQDATLTVAGKSLAISGVLSTHLTPSLSVLGRLGLSMWDFEAEISGVSGTIDSDGTDLLYGIGIQYDINRTVGIRGEYEIHEDLEFLNIGFIARF